MERAASLPSIDPWSASAWAIHIYSIREKEAHNAYLEIAAELGVMGLIAYLIVIFAHFAHSVGSNAKPGTCDRRANGRCIG